MEKSYTTQEPAAVYRFEYTMDAIKVYAIQEDGNLINRNIDKYQFLKYAERRDWITNAGGKDFFTWLLNDDAWNMDKLEEFIEVCN